LFEKMGIPQRANSDATLLIIGGGGGVGSMAIQLGTKVAGMKVIATASRDESREQCLAMGASEVINHKMPLAVQIKDLGMKSVDYILCLTDPTPIFTDLADIISPQGKICCLVESSADLPMNALRTKSVGFFWENLISQHDILNDLADLVDSGVLKTTLSQEIGLICARNLSKACQKIQASGVVGKIVMNGFD
jgi:alcohol dehydrogenase